MLGVGLGGFVDGIVLHQILQWHHMLTSADTANVAIGSYPPTTVHGLQLNTLWDGFFHAFTWLAVLIGLGMLYSRITGDPGRVWASRVLWGWMLVGWSQPGAGTPQTAGTSADESRDLTGPLPTTGAPRSKKGTPCQSNSIRQLSATPGN